MINYWKNISNVGHTLTIGSIVYMGLSDAEYLKSVRKALHLTQKEMAKKMGYKHQQAISAIENGDKGLSGPARKLLEYIEENEC